MTDDLNEMRQSLDILDQTILLLLAERFRVAKKIGHYKKDHNLPAVDADREADQLARFEKQAVEFGLDPKFAHRLLRDIIDEVVKNHSIIAATSD